jgi:hypothetical protein
MKENQEAGNGCPGTTKAKMLTTNNDLKIKAIKVALKLSIPDLPNSNAPKLISTTF